MNIQNPVIPSDKLIDHWWNESMFEDCVGAYSEKEVVIKAAQWGANQELNKCCELVLTYAGCGTKFQRSNLVKYLKEKRRPKELTLKEQALNILDELEKIDSCVVVNRIELLRRALEQLDD